MMRLVICICVLTVVAFDVLAMAPPSPKIAAPQPACKTDMLTVFLTGNELSALKPCGCSGGQLGGFDRRSAVFNSVPESKRLIVDTGTLVKGDSEQELIKFNIIIQAFSMLGYDLVNLTEKDVEIAKNLRLLDGAVDFNFIALPGCSGVDLPPKFTKQFSINQKVVTITVATFDAASPVEQITKLFTPCTNQQTFNILILNRCDDAVVRSVTKMKIVDCLVFPADSDEPGVLSSPDKRPLVVSVGRFGRYVCRLQITPPALAGELICNFSYVPVTEDLPQETSLIALYQTYQQLVKETGLLEKHPRFILPNGLAYAGSKSCKPCHEYEYQKWSTSGHAHAYPTLEKVGSQYDPECIICHVVGFEYQTGFTSETKSSEDLKNVGCENCHGPGSEHNATLGNAKTIAPMSKCIDCHTPETSGDYAANEKTYLEKTVHWKEPKAAANVKIKEGSKN